MAPTTLPPVPLAIATLLAGHGIRKGSLSPSGALTAFLVGGAICAVPLRTFAVSLVVFYLLGSRATKVGKAVKKDFEEGYADAGYRDGWQVLCNSASALVASALWSAAFVQGDRDVFSASWSLVGEFAGAPARLGEYASESWCVLSPTVAGGWSRALVFATLGHFACCLGDTLASELGILSRSPPILITTLQPVPPGTNGAISTYGTLASLTGGIIMGGVMSLSLLLENAACRDDAFTGLVVPLLAYGAFAGLFGSLVDSLLGATVQKTRYSLSRKQILKDDSIPPKEEDVKVISGYGILTNNQINLVSSVVTALMLAKLA